MPTVDVTGFNNQFPEFNSIDTPVIERALEEAKLIHGFRPLATLYVAAHIISLTPASSGGTGTGGDTTHSGHIVSEKVGPLTRQYASTQVQSKSEASSISQQDFMRTEYGRRFLTLERRSSQFIVAAKVV